MKINIVPIGNSRGIRIPGTLLDQCGFGETAELVVRNNQLVVSPAHDPRKGWDQSFEKMAKRSDDELIETPAAAFDDGEWKW